MKIVEQTEAMLVVELSTKQTLRVVDPSARNPTWFRGDPPSAVELWNSKGSPEIRLLVWSDRVEVVDRRPTLCRTVFTKLREGNACDNYCTEVAVAHNGRHPICARCIANGPDENLAEIRPLPHDEGNRPGVSDD